MKVSRGIRQCIDCSKAFELWKDTENRRSHNTKQIRCIECAKAAKKARSKKQQEEVKRGYC